jgi:hypothetical protein
MLMLDLIIPRLTQNQSSISHHYRCIHTNRLGGRKKGADTFRSNFVMRFVSLLVFPRHIGSRGRALGTRNGFHGDVVLTILDKGPLRPKVGGPNPMIVLLKEIILSFIRKTCRSHLIGPDTKIKPHKEGK